MDYDVVILGGGLAGCALAADLAQYNLNIAVIERNFDIAEDVSPFISTFVSDGSDIAEERLYTMQKEAHVRLARLSAAANFSYRREPCVSVFTQKQQFFDTLARIESRGIQGAYPLDEEQAKERSIPWRAEAPFMIYHEQTGIISPYDMATALGEIASENGVRFRLEEEVTAIERMGRDEVKVTTDKSHYTCRVVVITAYNDLYLGSKKYRRAARNIPLHTMLLEKNFETDVRTMVRKVNALGNASLVMPSFSGKTVATLMSPDPMDYKSVKKDVEALIGPFPSDRVDLLTVNNYYDDPVHIGDHLEEKGYLNLEVKNHYLPAMLPRLMDVVTHLVASNFKVRKNPDYLFKRRDSFRFRDLSDQERNELIAVDPRFGKMICTCSEVTEGEIVNAIRRPLGARTIEGVKRRTGIVFGSCQGAYCINAVLKILANELDKRPEDILNDRRDSRLLTARIKEFDMV
ncbi:Glycerol-3-phosphate dehydrogenase [Clostridiaceae bacterium JG1575]|nr:Glycerol-3-phosphate dehydrogenase [Clostridiaceae bacterium JG1575]